MENQGITYTEGYRNKYVSSCIYQMNRYGVLQAEYIKWAKANFEDYDATHRGNIKYGERYRNNPNMTIRGLLMAYSK